MEEKEEEEADDAAVGANDANCAHVTAQYTTSNHRSTCTPPIPNAYVYHDQYVSGSAFDSIHSLENEKRTQRTSQKTNALTGSEAAPPKAASNSFGSETLRLLENADEKSISEKGTREREGGHQ